MPNWGLNRLIKNSVGATSGRPWKKRLYIYGRAMHAPTDY